MRPRRTVAIIAGIAAALTVALAASGCSSSDRPGPAGAAPAGTAATQPLPPGEHCPPPQAAATSGSTAAFGQLTLPCLRHGPPVSLQALGGRTPVLVNLWASWCRPCQREMPRLQRAATLAGNRLLVLGVDTEDTADSARSFLRAVGSTYPQVVDSDGRLRTQLHAVGLPDTVLINSQGEVVFRKLGELDVQDLVGALRLVGIVFTARQLTVG